MIRRADGVGVQIPVERLYVDKRTKKQVSAADEKPNRRSGEKSPQPGRARGADAAGQDARGGVPRRTHAKLFELGLQRAQAKRLGGIGQLESTRSTRPRRRRSPTSSASRCSRPASSPRTIATSAEEVARTARSDLPQKMRPVEPKMLARHKAELRQTKACGQGSSLDDSRSSRRRRGGCRRRSYPAAAATPP